MLGRPPSASFSPLQEARAKRIQEVLRKGIAVTGELWELLSGQRDHEINFQAQVASGRPGKQRSKCKDCSSDISQDDQRYKSDRARCKECYSAKKKVANDRFRGVESSA